MKSTLLFAFIFAASLFAAAVELPSFASVDAKNGIIKLGPSLNCRLVHFGKGWSGSWQGIVRLDNGFPKQENGSLKFQGKLRAGGSKAMFDFSEALTPDAGGFVWEGTLRSAEKILTFGCALEILLTQLAEKDMLLINGKPLTLPGTPGTSIIFDRPVKNLVIVYGGNVYRIDGPCNLFVQDRRGKGLTLRLSPVGVPRQMDSWQLKLKFSVPDKKKIEEIKKITPPRSIVISAGKEWLPLEFDNKIIKGSPLDFSGRLDAPAGKYGAVTVSPDGHFSFAQAPHKRIRFTGINVVGYACFLPKAEADEFVDKIAALGYNSVRLHHFDNPLVPEGASTSDSVSPEQLDKLHYLTAKLKARGIYTTIDLYCSRRMKAKDNFRFTNYKAAIHIEPSVRENWKKFIRAMMTAKNPYTGMSWAEDPAIFAVNLVNEGALIQRYNATAELKKYFEAGFEKYLAENPALRSAGTRDGLFIGYLNKIQADTMADLTAFLRNELKVKALITDLNYPGNATLADMRGSFDFIDTHDYWDHPQHPNGWRLPFHYHGRSAVRRKGEIMRWIMPRRVFGKPFTVSEFNYCQPNKYRMEAPALFGGYASLQDWDGIWRFVWTESYGTTRKLGAPKVFEIIHDPQAQLAERIIHMLFRRGDVKSSGRQAAFRFSRKWMHSLTGTPGNAGHYPTEFSMLGLRSQIGTVLENQKNVPADTITFTDRNYLSKLPSDMTSAVKKDVIVSDTGEISLDHKNGKISVVTPRSEVLTVRGELAGKFMNVTGADKLQTVALLSLDDLPLETSRKMLLIQLPDLSAANRTFNNKECTHVQSWGTLPLLIQRAKADIGLASAVPYKVEMLKLDGSAAGKIPGTLQNGKFKFSIRTDARRGGVMAYLLTR